MSNQTGLEVTDTVGMTDTWECPHCGHINEIRDSCLRCRWQRVNDCFQRTDRDEDQSHISERVTTAETGIYNQDDLGILECDDTLDTWICLYCGHLNDIRSSCLRCGRDRDTGKLPSPVERRNPTPDIIEIIMANEAMGAVITLISLGLVFISDISSLEAGFVIMLTLGLSWVGVGFHFLNNASLREDWPRTNCEMIRVRRVRTEDARNSPWWVSHAWVWSYKYKVHGAEYRGTWVSIDKPVGSAKVYYNPNHPEQSTGDKKANIVRGWIDVLIGSVLIMAGMIVLAI